MKEVLYIEKENEERNKKDSSNVTIVNDDKENTGHKDCLILPGRAPNATEKKKNTW